MSKNRPLTIEQRSLLRRIHNGGSFPWMERGQVGRSFRVLKRREMIRAGDTTWLVTEAGERELATVK